MRAAKALVTSEERARLSQLIIERLCALPELQSAQTIVAYAALSDEVQTDTLLERLTSEGRTVLLPKVVDDEHMEMRRYTGPHDLAIGAYGIREPIGTAITDLSPIDVVIVPGMAFTASGERLGRGKGYYDRFLEQLPAKARKIGICFPFQLVGHIPTEPHDMRMDRVVSTDNPLFSRQ